MRKALILLLALPCLFVACKKDPVQVIDTSYNPEIKLSDFSDPTNFTNLYWPQELGKSYTFESQTPEVGMKYQEEYLRGEAEDEAEVIQTFLRNDEKSKVTTTMELYL